MTDVHSARAVLAAVPVVVAMVPITIAHIRLCLNPPIPTSEEDE